MSQLKAQVDKLLTGVASGYMPEGFVCEQVLPEITSKQYSGLLGKYGTSHLRIETTIKGGRGKYRRVETQQRSTSNFVIKGHGLEGMVVKEDYANVEDPFDAERDETVGISTILLLEKEKALADTLTSTALISQNKTCAGEEQFSDYNNSDPVSICTTARNTILDATGVFPNIAIMDIKVAEKLRFHPQLLDALGFKYARPGGLKFEEIAQALGVDEIKIAKARYESAKEGQASSLAPIWGKDIVFAVAPAKAAVMQVSCGYLVKMVGGQPRKVYKQPVFNPPGATEILVEDEYDMLLSNAAAVYLIKDAIA